MTVKTNEVSTKITNLEDLADQLNSLGYVATSYNDFVSCQIGGSNNPFMVVFTIDDEKKRIKINCQITKFGNIKEENLTNFAIACLDINSRIVPFAFATMTDEESHEDIEPEEWPVVLTDSVSMEDFSVVELKSEMNSLLTAIMSSRKVIKDFIN